MTVFTLSWATSDLVILKGTFINAVVFWYFFCIFIPVSALMADRIIVENAYLCHNAIAVFGFYFSLFLKFRQSSPRVFL
jgi:hypothetical protein